MHAAQQSGRPLAGSQVPGTGICSDLCPPRPLGGGLFGKDRIRVCNLSVEDRRTRGSAKVSSILLWTWSTVNSAQTDAAEKSCRQRFPSVELTSRHSWAKHVDNCVALFAREEAAPPDSAFARRCRASPCLSAPTRGLQLPLSHPPWAYHNRACTRMACAENPTIVHRPACAL